MRDTLFKQLLDGLIAGVGVFCGSLLWDVLFGDGIQGDDYSEAFFVALLAALLHVALNRRLTR